MNPFLILAILCIAVIAIFLAGAAAISLIFLKPSSSSETDKGGEFDGYYAKESFFTKSESQFHGALRNVAQGQFFIFSKVRLWDIVDVRRGIENRRTLTNRIQAKHVDFLLVDRKHEKSRLVIELDGESHNSRKQAQADQVKDSVLQTAGVPLLRIKVGNEYSEEALREQIRSAFLGDSKQE